MKIGKKYNYMVINGDYYNLEVKDGRPTVIKVDKDKVDKKIEKAKLMAEKLKEDLNREAILMEVLMNEDDKDFDKLYDMLFKSKRKYKPKTREGHCVDMKIGGFILPIV